MWSHLHLAVLHFSHVVEISPCYSIIFKNSLDAALHSIVYLSVINEMINIK